MNRSLWTAASGMRGQQLNIDTISNNLANVNTTSYKKQRVEFKDLLYSTIKRTNLNDNQGRPVNLEVGHGVMPVATTKDFANGSPVETQNPLDVAIDGGGFFAVATPNEEIRFTRDGSFKLSVDDGERILTTSEGYYILTEDEDVITVEEGMTDLNVDQLGNVTARNEDGEIEELGRLAIIDFPNPQGLLSDGSNLYKTTEATGEPIFVEADQMKSKVLQGYLESSNVQIVEEMVKMITAQRAYEINSKSIQTTDEMMQQANNLKR
ncbi:flagellar basal-body rod protein FlgG [Dethiothermospora halolimnae]|uniref:flagellar basal-body rod protein FlgG n=1 Tax=Dethiothermospora halolimnae TaxID=3114390 RepID=UPI003CCC1009